MHGGAIRVVVRGPGDAGDRDQRCLAILLRFLLGKLLIRLNLSLH